MIKGYVSLILRDGSGKVIDNRIIEMDSLVRNFLVMIEAIFKGIDSLYPQTLSSFTDINGNSVTPSFPTPQGVYGIPLGWRVDAEAGEVLKTRNEPTDWGIMVGSDDSPNTITVYRLYSPYPHGKGAGYMNYLSTSVSEPYFDGQYVRIDIKRVVANEADVYQVVKEIGLIAREYNTWNRILLAREVLSSPINMPPKSMLEVTISIVAVPALFNTIYVSDYSVGGELSTKSTI